MTKPESNRAADDRAAQLEQLRRLLRERLDERRRNPRLVPPDPPPITRATPSGGCRWSTRRTALSPAKALG